MAQILVVDDEIGIRELLSEILRDEGHDVLVAANAAAARLARNGHRPDLVLLDIWMPDTDGITLLKEWSANGQLTMPVIMMSGHGTIDSAVEATRIGALDFLEKPIALQKLLSSVKHALQRAPSQVVSSELSLAAFGRSSPLRDLKKRLDQVAEKSSAILLKSATGGIAELCARSLLAAGKGWLDLASLTGPLEISALDNVRGGILFVGELGLLSRPQQKNLAFALDRLEKYDLRLVSATTHPLPELIALGWDEPLLKRLFNVWLAAPGLAELKDEVPEMARQILSHLVESGEVPQRRLATGALNALRHQSWPGGYPELKAAIRSLALAALDEEIAEDDVRHLVTPPSETSLPLVLDQPLREAREAFERLYFEYHLRQENGNMTRLAEKSGLERTHLYRKLKSLGLAAGKKEGA